MPPGCQTGSLSSGVDSARHGAPLGIACENYRFSHLGDFVTMKSIIRAFFRALRVLLGPFMQLWEFATRPKGLVRAPAAQQAVDRQCQNMVLYQFTTCPFCIKVRQEMRRLSLPIERRDAQHDQKNKDDLLKGGGTVKVPCLKVTDANGQSEWIYESGAIITRLKSQFL